MKGELFKGCKEPWRTVCTRPSPGLPFSPINRPCEHSQDSSPWAGQRMPVPSMLWARPPSQQHLGAQLFGTGREDLCWVVPSKAPALKCSTLRMNESENLRFSFWFYIFYLNLFILQIGYIFKACHPQTFSSTKMSGMLCIIWNHLERQIICLLISQVARVDILGSFYFSDHSSILLKSDRIRSLFG